MPTNELIVEVLDFPFFIDLYLFNSMETGYKHVRKKFNSLDELLYRDNLGETVYKLYMKMTVVTQSILMNNFDTSYKE